MKRAFVPPLPLPLQLFNKMSLTMFSNILLCHLLFTPSPLGTTTTPRTIKQDTKITPPRPPLSPPLPQIIEMTLLSPPLPPRVQKTAFAFKSDLRKSDRTPPNNSGGILHATRSSPLPPPPRPLTMAVLPRRSRSYARSTPSRGYPITTLTSSTCRPISRDTDSVSTACVSSLTRPSRNGSGGIPTRIPT